MGMLTIPFPRELPWSPRLRWELPGMCHGADRFGDPGRLEDCGAAPNLFPSGVEGLLDV
jgi:hypothetical protein